MENIKWKGSGLDEVGYDENTGKELIFVSEKYFRPAEVEELLGDTTKARTELGWTPQYSFDDLVKEMVEEDCKLYDCSSFIIFPIFFWSIYYFISFNNCIHDMRFHT